MNQIWDDLFSEFAPNQVTCIMYIYIENWYGCRILLVFVDSYLFILNKCDKSVACTSITFSKPGRHMPLAFIYSRERDEECIRQVFCSWARPQLSADDTEEILAQWLSGIRTYLAYLWCPWASLLIIKSYSFWNT